MTYDFFSLFFWTVLLCFFRLCLASLILCCALSFVIFWFEEFVFLPWSRTDRQKYYEDINSLVSYHQICFRFGCSYTTHTETQFIFQPFIDVVILVYWWDLYIFFQMWILNWETYVHIYNFFSGVADNRNCIVILNILNVWKNALLIDNWNLFFSDNPVPVYIYKLVFPRFLNFWNI